ncbi:hypothetical protein ACWEOG_19325 [Amycolatopsis japonica]
MSGRPEETAGGYNDRGPDDYDENAWQEFTPWRPGDPSTINEAPASYAANAFADDRIYRPAGGNTAEDADRGTSQSRTGPDERESRTRWWTEASAPPKYKAGDQVKSRDAIGGPFMRHVDPGTRGEVVGKRSGLFGDEYLKVKFSNGYVEEVKPDAVRRDTWF